ncbi:acetyl-CoA carboxylase biotin carboxyl carrier protein [Blattabacterium cuenoti]|uniref:acetyl-CoA carboxylase biotin carboxyl carrier protein n=1 Tax=Blattabacterium cuenoti TaxID=1653831 RepID=UPI00163CE613|nr:acetyl-CoA carboxylase biotin carboxyl carrier protein [Blattabacterium cuenoti]
MDVENIKSIIQFISKSNISEVKIKIGNIKIYVKNNFYKKKRYSTLKYKKDLFTSHSSVNLNLMKNKNIKNIDNKYVTIKSPMIGIFYRKPHPDKPPFVQIGDIIKIGTKLCVIESMKLFNNIESEVNGKIIKIFVEDSSPVDYDQPLFLLESYH